MYTINIKKPINHTYTFNTKKSLLDFIKNFPDFLLPENYYYRPYYGSLPTKTYTTPKNGVNTSNLYLVTYYTPNHKFIYKQCVYAPNPDFIIQNLGYSTSGYTIQIINFEKIQESQFTPTTWEQIGEL